MATIASLAAMVGGRVVGDDSAEIDDLAPLDQAGPSHISFFANQKYLAQLLATDAGAVLVNEPVEGAPCPQIVCGNAYLAMAQLATQLHPPPAYEPGVHPSAFVHEAAELDASVAVCAGAVVDAHAKIGPRSVIGANAFVGRHAQLGEEVFLHPGSKVLERCQLHDRVILQSGAVIGSDGFGYAPDAEGRRHKIPQVGIVVLEEDVEIGANTTVDRATFGQTRIGRGTKLDNLVQIGHNVTLGSDCIVVSQSGIAGSAKAGNRLIMGAQTGMVGHIEIPDDVTVGARGALAQAVETSGVYSGVPAIPHRQWLKMVLAQQSLPEMRRLLRTLQKRIDTLEAKVEE